MGKKEYEIVQVLVHLLRHFMYRFDVRRTLLFPVVYFQSWTAQIGASNEGQFVFLFFFKDLSTIPER